MKTIKTIAMCAVSALAFTAAAEGLTEAQEAVAKAGPKKMRLMIAGFGNIESMTKVDQWLGETIPRQQNIATLPTLTEAEKCANPDLAHELVLLNWKTRKLEYMRSADAVDRENVRNSQMLNAIRMKVLTEDAMRYVPLAKDYLQAALSRKGGSLVQVVDRSNADMSLVEKAMNGDNTSALAGATAILTATIGDREEDSRTVPVNARTSVKTTTYTQPYTFKVRDLDGNVLIAESGTAQWSTSVNSVVKSEVSDPARKLIEKVCEEMADKLLNFFTVKLEFKVKAPAGMDADDAEVAIDGKDVEADSGVRVLAVEHALVATLDGCKPVRKVISIDEADGTKTVKINFKKEEAPKAESDDAE